MKHFSKKKLEEVAQNSLYTTLTNSKTILHSFEIFRPFLRSNSDILELGPAEGLMTEKLLEVSPNVTVVEGSLIFCQGLEKRFPALTIRNELFEDVEFDVKYDFIILGHVLEHVEDPILILNKAKEWLKDDGLILTAVPNARSLHRQVAVEMGLIDSIFDMSEKDIHHGHLRIYTPESFQTDFSKAGLKVINRGGYWIKPMTDSQIEKYWSEEMLNAFLKLGEFYPDIAAEIYIIASKN